MKHKFLFSTILLLLVVGLYIPPSFSQSTIPNPRCSFVLANDAMISTGVNAGREYQVDIYLLSNEVDPIELATLAIGLTYNSAILNGGTPNASWVSSSSQLGAQIPTLNSGSVATLGLIKIAGKTPPGAGGGTLISNVSPGTKVGRMRLTSTLTFSPGLMNTTWLTLSTDAYPTTLNGYVYVYDAINDVYNGTNTDLTPFATWLYSNIALPVELSTFTSNVKERQVNLNWETKTELNSFKYVIERASVSSMVAGTWASVGTVQAAGNSNSPKKYSFTEKNLQAGKYQYRLKIIDNDGSFKYSSVQSAEVAMPKEFSVSQNYPNPFNPTTKIDYQVPVDSKVIMEVYNITGQKVIVLVNQEQSAGYYTVDFGASKLASGVYIYRVVAIDKASGNNFSSIKKMMLLK